MAKLERAYHPLTSIPLEVEYVLDRPSAQFDREALRSFLANHTVLVTGAGGSIGRELSWQLAQLQPKQLILVDFSEFNLFHLEYSLNRTPLPRPPVFKLLDIRDLHHVEALLAETRPFIVFHAAAYKHVPMIEQHPVAAFQNNSLASVDLLHASERHGVSQFVFISTDKAVAPNSIMGTTKRLTEWYVRAANGAMQTKAVRFGNVFGSLGSVVPLFAEQIAAGGPVTVTDRHMERFFMSGRDACSLILQVLLFNSAPIYTLRMDPPVNILWLAERMIDILSPERPIDIEFVGIRPGEKLTEQLWSGDETPVDTAHKDILGLTSPARFSRAELDEWLSYLKALAMQGDPDALRAALFQTDFMEAGL